MRKGFTLIELVVVVLIMGILASLGMPYYFKTVETSKATNSLALGHLLANANRMYRLDNPGAPISGQITNTCNSPTLTCTAATGGCRLVACSYVAAQDWNAGSYNYFVCNPVGGAGGGYCESGAVSSVRRKAGASAPYSSWGYRFTALGSCEEIPEMTNPSHPPECPRF